MTLATLNGYPVLLADDALWTLELMLLNETGPGIFQVGDRRYRWVRLPGPGVK